MCMSSQPTCEVSGRKVSGDRLDVQNTFHSSSGAIAPSFEQKPALLWLLWTPSCFRPQHSVTLALQHNPDFELKVVETGIDSTQLITFGSKAVDSTLHCDSTLCHKLYNRCGVTFTLKTSALRRRLCYLRRAVPMKCIDPALPETCRNREPLDLKGMCRPRYHLRRHNLSYVRPEGPRSDDHRYRLRVTLSPESHPPIEKGVHLIPTSYHNLSINIVTTRLASILSPRQKCPDRPISSLQDDDTRIALGDVLLLISNHLAQHPTPNPRPVPANNRLSHVRWASRTRSLTVLDDSPASLSGRGAVVVRQATSAISPI